MFNAHTIEDTATAEREMERALAMLMVHRSMFIALGREAIDLAKDAPSNLTLRDYAEPITDDAWGYSENRASRRTLVQNGMGGSKQTASPYMVAQHVLTYAAFATNPKFLPKWILDENLKAGPQYRIIFERLIDLGVRAQQAAKNMSDARNECQQVCARFDDLAGSDASNYVGTYVTIKNSRRASTGWVVRGRGKTIYVAQDPLVMMSELSSKDLSTENLANHIVRYRAGQSSLTDEVQNPEKYTLSNARVEIVLPRATARRRRALVQSWLDRGARAWAASEGAAKDYEEWAEAGGPAAKARSESLNNIVDSILAQDLSASTRSGIGMAGLYANAMKQVIEDFDLTREVRRAMLIEAVKSQGGDLTEDEEALIAAEPIGGATSRDDAAIQIFVAEGPVERFID